jgi:hypothetical protein
MYEAKALIPKEVYSQKNIESLFRWYLKEHERDAHMLQLEIHIEDKTYMAARLCDSFRWAIIEPPCNGANRKQYNKYMEMRRLSDPVAMFFCQVRASINEPDYLYSYNWNPDPSNPDDFEIVTFKP